ncbi:MAG: type III-A CRISPR-associated protein Cas10/Csm1 [Clostridiales bacterium]|nr:type III-A CRISPR-associated protein Cas10/Csm1 [Clostridiales bacterium]
MSSNQKEYHDLILAAWLHDIGKFYQRSGFKLNTPKDEEAVTQLAKRYGTGVQTRYSHLHAIYSDKFFREYLPNFSIAGTLAALHHSPENAGTDRMRYLAKLITLADWMASGERRERESEEDSEGYQAEPLVSIFARLRTDADAKKLAETPSYIPLVPLKASLEEIFPVASKQQAFKEQDGQLSYKLLWNNFTEEIGLIDKIDIIRQIPYLLEKFTLTIPATTIDKPDISIYHHAKSTAALASCLYQIQLSEHTLDSLFGDIKGLPRKLAEEKTSIISAQEGYLANGDFLLVGGDLSGIQDFIYSVTSERALKGLRGRSFYLQLLSEVVSRLILRTFDLTEANLLYCGGGHFFILLPNINEAAEKLRAIREKVDTVLLQAHRGKLAIILEWVPVRYIDFFINFASIWTEVASKLGKMKRRKFASLFASPDLGKYWPKIMGPFDIGGERPACQICGEEIEKLGEHTCSLCESFSSLSSDLGRAKAISIEDIEAKPLPESISDLGWKDILSALGFDCWLWKERKEGPQAGVDEAGKEWQPRFLKKYLLLNSTDFAGNFSGFKFIASKITGPEGEILTLEEMADVAEGIKRWGILRADVDRLGAVFAQALGDDRTISRMSMLSSMLSLYFCARLNDLWRLKDSYQCSIMSSLNEKRGPKETEGNNLLDYVYIAYSGGDDLLLIGPWSVLPTLATLIYDDFCRFTSSKLTLSAGIYLAPSKKFPLYEAAREAGNAEEEAKKAGRNMISFLERVMSWEKLEEVRDIAYRIRNLLKGTNGDANKNIKGRTEIVNFEGRKPEKAVPRALLSVLYEGYRERELRIKGEIPMERIWRLFYAFKKIMTQFKKEEKILKELDFLLKKSVSLKEGNNAYEMYPELNIAIRWAEYLTRKENL